MKLIRKQNTAPDQAGSGAPVLTGLGRPVDRRTFLRRSGLAVGGAAAATALPLTMMRKAHAADRMELAPKPGVKVETRRSVCTHCSVGCGVIAEVQNGVWTGQEPDFDSPFNLG